MPKMWQDSQKVGNGIEDPVHDGARMPAGVLDHRC